ncbi:unnamed protein product [Brassica rapa subsp. trilocularis]
MEKVDLPVHNHPLLPLTRFSHGRCKGCWSHGYIYGGYRCNELGCDTLFYKECAESLPDINHSSHPDHPLKLVRKFQSSICSLCQVWFDTGYFCSICDFKLDLGCAWRPSPPLTLENTDTHEHQLVLSNGVGSELSQSTRNCKVCSSEVLEFKQYYECHQCELFFHVKCTKISLEEYHTSHPEHPLKFLTGDEAPGYADKKGCAENSSPLSVMSTKTHEHQLHLFQRLVDFTCNACGTRESFYCCEQCDYILHKRCANISIKKRHVCHNQPFTLHTSSGTKTSRCALCERKFTGFMYKSASHKVLDVRCGSV